MALAYIRPDKLFVPVHEQLQLIHSYALVHKIELDDEFVDHTSQNKRISDRIAVTSYFQSKAGSTLLVYDIWVLSTHMEDLLQMVSCLLKNNFTVHFVKQSIIMTQQSSAMLVCGLMDKLRQELQNESKKVIGRPKGSKSSSKFDKYTQEIITFIRQNKSVSEMARLLGVSRSSLKDYIESRELKDVAFGLLVPPSLEDAEESVIKKILCPNEEEK